MLSVEPDNQGPTTLDGVTAVTVLTAPASAFRKQAISIRTKNLDTSQVTAILERDVSGVKTEIDRVTIPPGVTDSSFCSLMKPIHLSATTHSLTMKLDGAPAANQPIVEVAFFHSADTP